MEPSLTHRWVRGPVLAAVLFSAASAQVALDSQPSRLIGQVRLDNRLGAMNLVEGRELNAPQSVALDLSISPPILYVADTGNNRVLAWKNAAAFADGAPADLIIGQKDRFSTTPTGPGTPFPAGLASPAGLAARDGDLYIADAGNNRILRFPRPFSQSEPLPDLVIGQPGFNSRAGNAGGISDRSLNLSTGATVLRSFLAFDRTGNLYASDGGNRRVLRYPASTLVSSARNGPAADLVIGQNEFSKVAPPPSLSAEAMLSKEALFGPSGVTLDPAGNLLVADSVPGRADLGGRVLVYTPPFHNGARAARIMGVALLTPGQPASGVERTLLFGPEGVFATSDTVGVADTLSHRILLFDPVDRWPREAVSFSPQARSVLGQSDFLGRTINRGWPEPWGNTLSAPVAAAAGNNEVFVADSLNHRVLVFRLPDLGVNSVATRVLGQLDLRFNAPNLVEGREFRFSGQGGRGLEIDSAIAADEHSDPPHLYVADTYNHRVLGFRDWRTVKPGDRADLVIGQPDAFRTLINFPSNDPERPGDTGLFRPLGLALDEEGNLYVADSGNGRVLRFPRPFEHREQRADLVIGQPGFTLKVQDATARTMAAPYGIALAGNRGLFVSDLVHNRVLFFVRPADGYQSGEAATKVFGQPDFRSAEAGNEESRMHGPRHIAIDSDDRLYAADTENARVLIFNRALAAGLPGRPAAVLVNAAADVPLRRPQAVFVDPATGQTWVGDAGANRVLRYPKFDDLPLSNFLPSDSLAATGPLAILQNLNGDLFVAESLNRVTMYFPGLTALNAANYLPTRALSPGMVASVFPLNGTHSFGQETVAPEDPVSLPHELGDLQVLVQDQPAPLFFISPSQINFQVPMATPAFGAIDLQVVRKSTGQVVASGRAPMHVVSPALFTVGNTGSGQVIALNQDGSVNSSSNPAQAGTVISVFGTGQGFVPDAPPDGERSADVVATDEKPDVIVGTAFVPPDHVEFSGLAPRLVGVWQINVRIPKTVAPGAALVVVRHKGVVSTNERNPAQIRTTIAVRQ